MTKYFRLSFEAQIPGIIPLFNYLGLFVKRSYIAIFIILVILLASFIRISSVKERFVNYDSAGIAYNASIILNDEVPYKDTAEWKDPASFFLFALSFKIFGKSLVPVRIIANLWILLTCFLLYLITYRLSNQKAALFVFFLYGVFSFNSDLGDINYNTWMVLPYVLAMYLFVLGIQKNRLTYFILSGAAGALGIFFKKQGFVFFPMAFTFLVIQLLFEKDRYRLFIPLVWKCLAFAIGIILTSLPFIIYFAYHGSLSNFFYGFVWNKGLVTYSLPGEQTGAITLLLNGLSYLFIINPQVCIMFIAGLIFLLIRKYFFSQEGILVLLWLLFSFIAVSIGFRFTFFYFSQLLPAMCLVAALPFERFRFRWSIVAAVALLISTPIWETHLFYYGKETYHSISHMQFIDDPYTIKKEHLVANYIKENTDPDDPIFIWGWHGMGIYFYSERFSPSPVYKQLMVLTTPNTNTGWEKSEPIHIKKNNRFRDMLITDFNDNPPKYFVFTDSLRQISEADQDPIYEFTELTEILDRDYVLDRKIGRYWIYKNKRYALSF